MAKFHHRGFTLLEMMVVLVLVGLISAMLMQGFVYVAGIYNAVERRQVSWQHHMLQRAWLQESVRSLTNGVDGELAKNYYFRGNEQGFSGLAVQGLSYAGGVGRPVRVQWQLEQNSEQDVLSLRYREIKLGQEVVSDEENPWYLVGRWSQSQGEFSYYSHGQWLSAFSGRSEVNKFIPLVPDLIRLRINSDRDPIDLWLATAVSPYPYRPPKEES